MLMQNFKRADELELNDAQYDALCKTLVLMETGKVKHVPSMSSVLCEFDKGLEFTGLFNMSNWFEDQDCGTVACIGGTACVIGNSRALFDGLPGNTDALFYPNLPEFEWDSITVEQGARALRNYLTTGDPKWQEVCPS